MKTPNLLIAVAGVLLGTVFTGCTAGGTGASYQDAVSMVDTMLTAKVDNGIFGLSKNAGDRKTTFRFIEGSRTEKIDHARPLRVEVMVRSRDDGRGSGIGVEAIRHGIMLKQRDRDAEVRWQAELAEGDLTPL